MNTYDWFTPLSLLPGVGTKTAEKLNKLALFKVGDLLLHFPTRYQDRTHLTPIVDLLPSQDVVIQGSIISVKSSSFRQKKRCEVIIADKLGKISLIFFHAHPAMLQKWQMGVTLRCFGQVKGSGKKWEMIHPECEIIEEGKEMPGNLTPVYPLTEGLTQNWFRKTIEKVLAAYKEEQREIDLFQQTISKVENILPWREALSSIHQPTLPCDINALENREHPAFKRLILEEIYAHHLGLQKIKNQLQAQKAPSLLLPKSLFAQFIKALPFSLTDSQEEVWQEIQGDLKENTPMLRLVQGDVGCGKTVISALATLAAVTNQVQVALMVPTEILAEQHFQAFQNWFSPLGFRCDLLTGKLKTKAKRLLLENIQLGLTQIVIGTHALFQDAITFQHLGLVVIDEQHRFGVHQRFALQEKGLNAINPISPHQLIMTATPIPRTLAMSHYAHLEISSIKGLPIGRKPIVTLTISQTRRKEIIARIASVCANQEQVYWVCPLIDESEVLDCQAAEEVMKELKSELDLRIGLVHGRMSSQEKETVMQAFYAGEIAILVATTVIEVGVNVPQATLMIIENPERLGLAQLHQLRGRVGRGDKQSYCILLYQAPLTAIATERLRIMRDSQDGFYIAEADLELRGPGEILGIKQTGGALFKVVDFKRDKIYFKTIPEIAKQLIHLPATQREDIIQRWFPTNHYGQA